MFSHFVFRKNILNIAIVALIIVNIIIHINTFYDQGYETRKIHAKPEFFTDEEESILSKEESFYHYKNSFIRYEKHIANHSDDFDDVTYTESELEEAIKGLNLPTWSRSYVHCNNSESEVTCKEVVSAWKYLKEWISFIKKHPFNERRKHLLLKSVRGGVGNRLSTSTVGFMIALLENRSFVMEALHPKDRKSAKGQAFEMNEYVDERKDRVDVYFKETGDRIRETVQTMDDWYSYDFINDFESSEEDEDNVLFIDNLLYSTMIYTNGQLSKYARKHFGMHAGYFISNFLMKLPKAAIEEAKRVTSNVPSNVRIFGVHLRYQQAGNFYSYNISQTMNVVVHFLKQKLIEKPTVFAFASDSKEMEEAFIEAFPNNTITAKTKRLPDFDHPSALNDLALLEMCDELLVSYRSTFSHQAVMRTGKRAWFIEKEAENVFISSNSQATAISALYHQHDENDWQMNRRVHINTDNEEALRYYCKYFLI